MKMFSRRQAARGSAAAGLTAITTLMGLEYAAQLEPGVARALSGATTEQHWLTQPCEGCGLSVAFVTGQRINRCGHCHQLAYREA